MKFTGENKKRCEEIAKIDENAPAQRTLEWFKNRYDKITASVFGQAIPFTEKELELYKEGLFEIDEKKVKIENLKYCYIGKTAKDLYADKIQSFEDSMKWSGGSAATLHGTRFEPAAIAMYEQKNRTKVYEFGMVPHAKYHFLGASPDGITQKGVMLEIKCPYSRVITGVPKLEYWCQIQLQTEVCDLDLAHFLECKIETYTTIEEYLADIYVTKNGRKTYWKSAEGYQKGIILEVIEKDGETKHRYHKCFGLRHRSHKTMMTEINEWFKEHVQNNMDDLVGIVMNGDYEVSKREFRLLPWKCSKYSCVEVERNKEWFQSILPKVRDFWKDVEDFRTGRIKEVPKKYKKRNQNPDGSKKPRKTASYRSLQKKVENTFMIVGDD